MSAAFTTLSSGGNAQSLAMANEIVLAYSERRQAIGQGAVSALSAGGNAQDKTQWLAMQNWLEANCVSFIDHVNGPFKNGAFLYFTLATWQASAGLNVSAVDGESFRRRINPSDANSYGHITVGDCRGDWCFEDLQDGFSALKKSTLTPEATGSLYAGSSAGSSWSAAKSAAESDFKYRYDYSSLPYSYTQGQYNSPTSFEAAATSIRAIFNYPSAPFIGAISSAVYAWTYAAGVWDANGLAIEENKYSLLCAMGESFGLITVPVWCAEPTSGVITRGFLCTAQKAIIEWNFANI